MNNKHDIISILQVFLQEGSFIKFQPPNVDSLIFIPKSEIQKIIVTNIDVNIYRPNSGMLNFTIFENNFILDNNSNLTINEVSNNFEKI